MAESDQYYIRQCLNGQSDEFRFLVGRYQNAVLAFLAGKFSSRADAEEAAQETFVRAYFALAKLKNQQVFYSWLLGIANRVAKEQLRQTKTFADVENVAVAADKKEVDFDLEKAVAKLPESYREVILLKFYAGKSCAQISEQLDMPIGTVTKKLSRAYANLRETLNEVHK